MSNSFEIRSFNTNGVQAEIIPGAIVSGTDLLFDDGYVSVTAPRTSIAASRLAKRLEVALFLDGVEIDNTRALLVEHTGNPAANEDARGTGDTVVYGGKTMYSRLSKAVVYPSNWPAVVPAYHDFNNATPGLLLRALFGKAQTRGAIPWLDYSTFTDTIDSSGSAWAKTVSLRYQPGVTYSTVIENLIRLGVIEFRMSGRKLKIYNAGGVGSDFTLGETPFIVRRGRDAIDTPYSESTEDLYNTLLTIGDAGGEDTPPIMFERSDATSVGTYGREESSLSQGGTQDVGTLTVLSDASISRYSSERGEYSVKFAPNSKGPQPFRDFNTGDWVFLDKSGTLERYRVRQLSITTDDGAYGVTATLNDKFMELDLLTARRVEGIIGGAGADTVQPAKPVEAQDTTAPAKPTGLSITSNAYTGFFDGIAYTQATIDWNDVTTNANGTPAYDIDHYEVRWKIGASGYQVAPNTLTPGRPHQWLNSIFDRRNKGLGFIGGDGANSMRLVDGTDLWVFSDSAIGTADGSNAIVGPWGMVNNCFVKINPTTRAFTTLFGTPNTLPTQMANPGSGGTSTDYWANVGTITSAYSSDWAAYGAQSLKMTFGATAGAYALGPAQPVTPGAKITVRATFRAGTTVRNCRTQILFYAASGTSVANTVGAYVTDSATGVDLVDVFDVPANAATGRILLYVAGYANGEIHYVDKLSIQDGDRKHQAWQLPHGGTYASLITPESLGWAPEAGYTLDAYWCWVGDAWTANGKVYVTTMLLRRESDGSYGNLPGTYLCQWNAATLAYEGSRLLATGNIVFSDCVYVEGGYVYILGHTSASISDMYMMQLPLASPMTSAPQFRTASGWSASATAATIQINQPIGAIKKIGTTYSGLFILGFATNIYRMTASAITGPWTIDSTPVYRMPEVGSAGFAYIPRFHPQYDSSDGLVYGYSQNTGNDWTKDLSHSGPRFAVGPQAAYTVADMTNLPWYGNTTVNESTAFVSGIAPASTLYAEVRTVDRSGNTSPDPWASTTAVVAPNTIVPLSPSTAIVEPTYRGLRATWDGLDINGSLAPKTWRYAEVHVSKDGVNYVPTQDTLYGTLPGAGSWPINGLEPNTTYWVRFVALGMNGIRSAPSPAVAGITAQLVNADLPDKLITAAMIADGAINTRQLNVAAMSDSLVPNLDFEGGDNGAGVPDGWLRIWGDQTPQIIIGTPSIAGNKSFKITATVGGLEIWKCTPTAISDKEIVYWSGTVQIPTPLAGTNAAAAVRLLYGTTAAECDGFHGAAELTTGTFISTAGNGVVKLTGNSGTMPAGTKFCAVALVLQAGAGQTAALTCGGVELKKIVGGANINEASINMAKISFLDLNDAKVGSMKVDKLTGGLMTADVIIGGQFKTGNSNPRITIDAASGVAGYNPSGQLVTQLGTDGGLTSRYLRTNTSGTRIELGTYASQGSAAFIAFIPDTQSWQFPPGFGFGGDYVGNYVPGIAMHAGSLSSANYNKYGLSMMGLSQVGGITLITGNRLDATESTNGSDININANGATSTVTIQAGGADKLGKLVMTPAYGASVLRLIGGRFEFGIAAADTGLIGNTIKEEGSAWNGLGAYHFHMINNFGMRIGSASEDWLKISSSGLLSGNGAWGTPKINTRSGGAYIAWDNSGGAYVNNSPTKTFVINHPVDKSRYLVHATNEMPEARVDYTGNARLVPAKQRAVGPTRGFGYADENDVEVVLPDYFSALVDEATAVVIISPYYDTCEDCEYHSAPSLAATRVTDGKFSVKAIGGVYHPCIEFGWRVSAERKDTAKLVTEPLKKSVTVHGDGPYTYITS